MNFRYPIFLDLRGKKCLVTGARPEIPAKIRALVDASAPVTYVNPTAEADIRELCRSGAIQWIERDFQAEDLDDCFLVISGLEDNSEIFRLAEQRQVLCNSVDDPACCRFSFGSIHRQGDLTIAISTNGWAPALAVRIRQQLEGEIGAEYARLLDLLKEARAEIATRVPDFAVRRDLWYNIIDSEALAKLRQNRHTEAAAIVRDLIDKAASSTSRSDTYDRGGDQ